MFLVNFYEISQQLEILDSKLIIGGKAFGLMGTDELRRDLIVGLLWGTPLALFIGIVVAIGAALVKVAGEVDETRKELGVSVVTAVKLLIANPPVPLEPDSGLAEFNQVSSSPQYKYPLSKSLNPRLGD